MNKLKHLVSLAITIMILVSCNPAPKSSYEVKGAQSQFIVEMIDAVNEKDAGKYVSGFADSVKVYVESDLKVNGRNDLKANRANHFEAHPEVRSEIQHLVEIDNKVILHDKVWLDQSDEIGQNIVEIFTFENGKIIRVDVIQPKDLFNR